MVFYKIRTDLARWGFNNTARGILSTPPLRIKPAPLTIFSLVSARDFLMYLIAIKSFYEKIAEGQILVINDGSLTSEHLEYLRFHLSNPTLVNAKDVDTGICPRNRCYERWYATLDIAEDHYVIQLDSDTLTRDEIAEVVQCYRDNRAFILGTRMGREVISLSAAARVVQDNNSTHVQIVAERNFAALTDASRRNYVRGCAGFYGLPKGKGYREQLENFYSEMYDCIGDKWHEWGSEQVTSNYIIANSQGAVVLPFPKYASFDLNVSPEKASFLHFLGTYRFKSNVYRSETKSVISSLG